MSIIWRSLNGTSIDCRIECDLFNLAVRSPVVRAISLESRKMGESVIFGTANLPVYRLMLEATQIQQAVLDKLRQLPLEKQQVVLTFVDSLDTSDPSSEQEWSLSAIAASVHDLLNDPEEDIYTLEDGEPIADEA
ncbi:hypothetical protein [Phormidesmis sp. 146-33]